MKTYIEMLVTRMVYERLGRYEKVKEYMKFNTSSSLADINLLKEKIEKYNLEGASETNIREFIKKVSLIEYYKVIGDFNASNKIESELKALKREIIIESILQK
jgi:hypothetical protein